MPESRPAPVLIAAEATLATQIQALVAACNPRLECLVLADGQAALQQCRARPPRLVIASGSLPGLDGIALLRELRGQLATSRMPFILIDGPTDSASVRAALPLSPTAYLAPPFNPDKLRQRLQTLLQAQPAEAPASAENLPELPVFIERARAEGAGAPMFTDMSRALAMRLDTAGQDLTEVERLFMRDPQITARLIAEANDQRGHSGQGITRLPEALAELGVQRSLERVLDGALQAQARLEEEQLASRAEALLHASQQAAERAGWLARRLELDAQNCFTAGLLHNLGDLSLLRILQRWCDAGGHLDAAQIDQALHLHAASLGAHLRIQWRLPFALRELNAAYYNLGNGVHSREALVMNLTGQSLRHPEAGASQLAEERAARLLRLSPALLQEWLAS